MPTREEMLAELKGSDSPPSREEMIASLKEPTGPSREEMLASLQEKTPTQAPEKKTNMVEAGLLGAGSAASFGLGDELAGLAGAITDPLIYGNEENKSFGDRYRESRDYARKLNDTAYEEHPVSYGTGYVAGSIGGAKIAAKAITPVANKVIKSGVGKFGANMPAIQNYLNKVNAGVAATEGALQAAGSSEADLTKGEVGKFASDVAGGTVAGAVVPHVL